MQECNSRSEDIIYSEELGSGQFGVVVKCTIPDEAGELRTYAAKLPTSADEFIVESFALKVTQHPLVVTFFSDLSKLHGNLIMDYFPLGNLESVKQFLDRDFTSLELRFIFDQCVEALTHVHSRMIIHNDVKPTNILMDSSGRIRLADFGSARVCFRLGTRQLYPSEDRFCSHLPPEAAQGSEFWHAIDWFSVASVVYYLAHCDFPYPRTSSMNVDEIEDVFSTVVTFRPTLTSDLMSLLQRMLLLNPQERLGGGEGDGLEIMMDKEFSHSYERHGRFSVKKARNFICRRTFPRFSEILSYALQ